jgi:hypothetical protein
MEKVILKQVVESLEALGILTSLKLPVYTSFKLSVFLKNVSPLVEAYEKERNKLINEYGTEDTEKPGTFNIKDEEKIKEFNEKIMEVLNEEIEVKIPEINAKELGAIEIEPKHLISLTWLIKE